MTDELVINYLSEDIDYIVIETGDEYPEPICSVVDDIEQKESYRIRIGLKKEIEDGR